MNAPRASSVPVPRRHEPIKPEVLAPAGDARALAAAVRSGADAVYFGLQDWNARVRARNFQIEDLEETIRELHRDGVRAYLAFNTLLFREEQAQARRALEAIAAAGCDAVIIQDLSAARWIHDVLPRMAIHASTQTTVSSVEGIEFLRRFGVRRVILARELALPEIRRIRAATDVELEVFVHGALCVSYSGQCLSSEAWGGRSANRGQCAQACRLPYDLIVDGARHDLGDRAYLLSPHDLEGVRHIPALIEIGIHGVKIEGRMKSAEYVAAATSLYREAVDRAWAGRLSAHEPALEQAARDARAVFSRGVSDGFLGGVNHQVLVDGRIRAHRGLRVGKVTGIGVDWIEIAREAGAPDLAPGDGILLAAGPHEEQETGAKIFAVEPAAVGGDRGRLRLRFGRSHGPDLERVRIGCAAFLTHDHALLAELARKIDDPSRRRRTGLTMIVTGSPGEPLRLACVDPEGRRGEAASRTPLIEAERHGLDRDALESHLGRLGATRFHLERMEIEIRGSLALPVSELNEMRREVVASLERLRAAGVGEDGAPAGGVSRAPVPEGERLASRDPVLEGERLASPVADAVERAELAGASEAPGGATAGAVASPAARAATLTPVVTSTPVAAEAAATNTAASNAAADPFVVLCRSREQVEAALEAGSRRIVLDFLDLVGLKEAIVLVRDAGAELTLALPRIQKPGEEKIWDFFLSRRPDRILARNLASIARLGGSGRTGGSPALVADVSLNAVNPESIDILLEAGCSYVSPGLDLNGPQLLALLDQVPAERVEVPLHHHLPVFHTEHCVFAAFLSDGADWRTCGRPCDRHRIHLRDRTGQEHAVIADVGCRNTVFGARPQSVVHLLPELRRKGVASFRLELLEQDAAATRELLSLYRKAWSGSIAPPAALGRLRAEGRFGVFAGSPELPRKPDWKPQGGRRGRSRRGAGSGPAARGSR